MGAAVAFAALFVLQTALTAAPRGALAQRLYPWFYGGLFLDEKFNSLAFAVWHPPSPAVQPASLASLPVVSPVASPLAAPPARFDAAPVPSLPFGAQS
jgi:NAD(P)H-quinone oxidoreductase subunit 5